MDGRSALAPIADKVERGERLTRDDALALFHSNDLLTSDGSPTWRTAGATAIACASRRISTSTHERVCAAQHLRILLLRAHATGGRGVHAEPREVFAEADAARDNLRASSTSWGAASQAAARLLRRHVPRPSRPRHPDVHIKALTAVEIAHLARIEKLSSPTS